MKRLIKFVFCTVVFLSACNTPKKFVYKVVANTPEAGFDAQNSDAAAVALADSIENAHGGRYAWNKTRYIKWSYSGQRDLIWDKTGEKVRIDFAGGNLKIRLNLKNNTGIIWQDGMVLTQPDSVKKYSEYGKNLFTNDAWWLLMPFKLKGNGMTLKSEGKKTNAIGAVCDAISATFNNTGNILTGKYLIYTNPVTHIITQWDFYQKPTDEKPILIIPNSEYRAYGHLLLSANRGMGRSLAPVAVYSSMPDSVFTSFYPVDWRAVKY